MSGSEVDLESGGEIKKAGVDDIISHYWNDDNIIYPSGWIEFAKQIIMILLAALGSVNYLSLAIDYSKRMHGKDSFDNHLFYLISNIIGMCLPAAVVLWLSTEIFLRNLFLGRPPERFKQALHSPYGEYLPVILVGAAASALPLAFISLSYRLPVKDKTLQDVLAWVMFGITLLCNTVMHFLPFQLIIGHPVYGAPWHVAVYIWKRISEKCCAGQEKTMPTTTANTYSIPKLKQDLINRISLLMDDISINAYGCGSNHLQNTSPNLQASYNLDQLITDTKQLVSNQANSPCLNKCKIPDKIYTAAFYAGSILSLLSTIGNIINAVDLIANYVGYVWAMAAMAIPGYCLGVLLMFFGGNAARSNLQYWTSFRQTDSKTPYIARLFPAIFLIAVPSLILYPAYFSTPGSLQLLYDNLGGWKNNWFLEALLKIFEVATFTGVPYVVLNILYDFFQMFFEKIAIYSADKNTKSVARNMVKLGIMKQVVGNMKEETLSDWLDNQGDSFKKQFPAKEKSNLSTSLIN